MSHEPSWHNTSTVNSAAARRNYSPLQTLFGLKKKKRLFADGMASKYTKENTYIFLRNNRRLTAVPPPTLTRCQKGKRVIRPSWN
jgi:hypothetical protein